MGREVGAGVGDPRWGPSGGGPRASRTSPQRLPAPADTGLTGMSERKTEPKYYKGFPGRLRRKAEPGLLGHALMFSFRSVYLAFVLSYGAVTVLCLYKFLEEKRPIILPVAAVTGVIFVWLAKGLLEGWFGPKPEPRILPYFQKISGVERLGGSGVKELGGIDSYLHGYAIARNCQALDILAAELNLPLLSDFGFNDDHRGEEPTWHPAEAGLSTITRLLQELRRKDVSREMSLDKPDEVVADLERIELALCRARDKSVPFCFILLVRDFTNAQEHEQRLGTFF